MATKCILKCRTAEMGAHVSECDSCHKMYIHYNSCKNRNCPMCQGMEVDEWIDKRQEDVLGIMLVYMVMASQFESLLAPFIIAFSIPFGFVGAIVMLYLKSHWKLYKDCRCSKPRRCRQSTSRIRTRCLPWPEFQRRLRCQPSFPLPQHCQS